MNNGSASRAIISYPVKVARSVMKHREKARLKRLEQQGTKYFEGHRELPPIISCRVPQLNHYQGQVYHPDKKLPLASAHWPSRRTIGDFFSIVPFHGNYSSKWNQLLLNRKLEEQEILDGSKMEHLKNPKFSSYNFDPRIPEILESLGFKTPTNIQDASFDRLLSRESAIVASETGNGKTLAYLLPIIQQVINLKTSNPSLSNRRMNSPFSVIVTPGRELSSQVFEVAQQISSKLGIQVRIEMGGSIRNKMIHGDRRPTDILIGTLGGLSKMFSAEFLNRDYINSIVLDEADTLVDESFSSKTLGFLSFISSPAGKKLSTGNQFIFVSATFPHHIKTALSNLVDFDDFPIIRTHYLHRVLSHVQHKFIRAPKVGRPSFILDLIQKDVQKCNSLLIFSNKSSTADFVSRFLCDRGIDSKHFSADINWRSRGKVLDDFLSGKTKVLSCTDLVSRGIDTTNVGHVINYDFPSNVSDYIHRSGRVGRVGTKLTNGKVTSLVCGQNSIKVVQNLETAVRLNKEIADVDSNILRMIKMRHGDYDDEKTNIN